MTIRRGMADYRQAGAGGIIFMGLLQLQGQEMTYEQTRIVCRRVYSAEMAKLEIADEKISKDETVISSTKLCWKLITQAVADYRSHFESHQSTSDAENNYAELLSQIVDELWKIAIRAKLIENITVEQDAVG
jgi:hypothetical protein